MFMCYFQLRLGYRCFTGQELSASWLQQRRPHATSFSFEEFCCIVAEYKQKVSDHGMQLASHPVLCSSLREDRFRIPLFEGGQVRDSLV